MDLLAGDECLNLTGGAGDGASAQIEIEVALGEPTVVRGHLPRLRENLPSATLGELVERDGCVATISVQFVDDGAAAIVTFIATIFFAPHLDNGILIGAGLAIVLFLLRTMKPRVALLGRSADGTLRDIKVNPGLPTSEHIMAMRYDGSLYFANVSYFEDAVLEALVDRPQAKYVLIVGDGINQMDASGEEVVHHLFERLHDSGVTLVFSGLKRQVIDVMRQTGLYELIGQHNIFATEDQAITAIYERLGHVAQEDLFCPVRPAVA